MKQITHLRRKKNAEGGALAYILPRAFFLARDEAKPSAPPQVARDEAKPSAPPQVARDEPKAVGPTAGG